MPKTPTTPAIPAPITPVGAAPAFDELVEPAVPVAEAPLAEAPLAVPVALAVPVEDAVFAVPVAAALAPEQRPNPILVDIPMPNCDECAVYQLSHALS